MAPSNKRRIGNGEKPEFRSYCSRSEGYIFSYLQENTISRETFGG